MLATNILRRFRKDSNDFINFKSYGRQQQNLKNQFLNLKKVQNCDTTPTCNTITLIKRTHFY